ncbi:MAG TPA: 2,3-bisphosphoglycerate-independent phosphoglycerate mutase [Longimicrobiales bacterium]|nr:2,3-bisphosphoglycerate-independent phosphoglycerate mutase [Longimicrobiales bacterium]
MSDRLPDAIVQTAQTRIVFVVMDGLGGLPDPATGRTELETARTPNLDRIARDASAGLGMPVGRGITPGSGPGHLALFGYDPIEFNIGRGVLSALGIDFPLRAGDIAARLNFATLDGAGNIVDRRAGRPNDEENARLVEKLRAGVKPPAGIELYFESEREHRLVLILRGENLSADLSDTDPQKTGVPPLPVTPTGEMSRGSARIVQSVIDACNDVLRDESAANGVLARGFAAFSRYPSISDRYLMSARAIARYPMYRGLARLLGMEVLPPPATDEQTIDVLADGFGSADFHFVHFKYMDSRGEDGDFGAKVEAIEKVDALFPRIEALKPDVLVVTGDHSTPSRMRAHSWHPVPVLLASKWTRPAGLEAFGERDCLRGDLGIFPMKDLMALILANARRLQKFGA